MNRRTFLRQSMLATAGVLVAGSFNVPSITPPEFLNWPLASSHPLTYEMLERAYADCIKGPRQPFHMVVNHRMSRYLKENNLYG